MKDIRLNEICHVEDTSEAVVAATCMKHARESAEKGNVRFTLYWIDKANGLSANPKITIDDNLVIQKAYDNRIKNLLDLAEKIVLYGKKSDIAKIPGYIKEIKKCKINLNETSRNTEKRLKGISKIYEEKKDIETYTQLILPRFKRFSRYFDMDESLEEITEEGSSHENPKQPLLFSDKY